MTTTALLIALFLQAVTAARINGVGGQVEITRATETAIAQAGDAVLEGARLHTFKDAYVTLSTQSGVTFHLDSDSRLVMKKVGGEALAYLSEGAVGVVSSGRPVRVETKYGQLIGGEDSQEFDVRYAGDAVQVVVIRGSITAEASEPSKIVFKSVADLGTRVYEAGSTSPIETRSPSETPVIVYPSVYPAVPIIRPTPRRVPPTTPRPPSPPR